MPSAPKELGTLIVIILKARNLPDKRRIGKQDPYCVVEFNKDKRRSQTVRRGGQHPEWDHELRYTLLEDPDDDAAPSPNPSGSPPPPPPKRTLTRKIQGGNIMTIACYADDPKEPEFIGEGKVDLTEVFTKGETDEWFTIMNKDKYCGEVYLELTFWSNDKPPEKKPAPQTSISNPNYGGPGSFTPNDHSKSRSGSGSDQMSSPSRGPSYDGYATPPGANTSVPNSLRASGSLAKLDLYTPPYERRDHGEPNDSYDISGITQGMAELGVRRQGSYPPLNGGESYRGSEIDARGPYSLSTHDGFRPVSSMSYASSVSSFPSSDSYASRPSAFSSGYASPYQDDAYQRYPQYFPPAISHEPPWSNHNPPPGTSDHFTSNPTATPVSSHFVNGRPLPSASGFVPPSNAGNQSYFEPTAQQSVFANPPISFPNTSFPAAGTPGPPTHYAPLPPASAPPTQPYVPPATPIAPPLSNSAPPPLFPTSSFSTIPTGSPLRNTAPNQPHLTPPSATSRPLPDPYNQSSFNHAGTPSLSSSQGPSNRPLFPAPGPPPPLPPARRSSLPFPPPPPPPSVPLSSFPSPNNVTPSNSFDFSNVPPPPTLRNGVIPPPPPPPPPQLGQSSSMYPVQPPLPLPPNGFDTGVRY